METIAIINLKGGVGKTMSSANIGYTLAEKHNKNVLLIDNDKQGNLSKFYDVHSYDSPCLTELLVKSNIDVLEVIQNTDYENIDIIPSNMTLLNANKEMLMDNVRPQQTRLKNALDNVKSEYDYCIIDNAPDLNISTINALVVADIVLIPIKIDKFAFDGLDELLEQIEIVKAGLNHNIIVKCFVTMYRNDEVNQQGLEWLGDNYDMLKTHIRYTKKIDESTFASNPIMQYSSRCGANKDYVKLADGVSCVVQFGQVIKVGEKMAKFNMNTYLNSEIKAKVIKDEIKYISIYDIVPSKDNFYNVDDVEELKESILLIGLQQNLVVRTISDNKYELVAGHRRLKALLSIVGSGYDKYKIVPCMVTDNDEDLMKIQLIMTNSTTRELSEFEKMKQATELKKVLEKMKSDNKLDGGVRKSVAELLKMSNTQVARYEVIEKNLSNEVKEKFETGEINVSVAYETAKLPLLEQEKVLEKLEDNSNKVTLNDVKKISEEVKVKQERVVPPVASEEDMIKRTVVFIESLKKEIPSNSDLFDVALKALKFYGDN